MTRSTLISELEKSTTIDEFELLDMLGQGSFGSVHLARHLGTGAAVAMKIVAKSLLHETKQELNSLREQRVHLNLEHPLIAKLYTTFQDKDALYFVLEFCPGGEIYSLVYPHDDGHAEEHEAYEELDEEERRQHGRRMDQPEETESESEEEHSRQQLRPSCALSCDTLTLNNFLLKQRVRSARGGLHERYVVFYAACVVTALEYVHKRGVLYRDLKLENLVVDAEGYAKLIDFGLSKSNATQMTERSWTMCGSAEYMAPEILQHKVYDQRVDLWSFGILLYEMLFGSTPFYHANKREQGRRIISEPVLFPDNYEQKHPAVCALIQTLLEKDPALRLATFTAVKTTDFFRTYFPSSRCWQQIEMRQVKPPFIPRLNGLFDTSLFVRVRENCHDANCSNVDSDFGY